MFTVRPLASDTEDRGNRSSRPDVKRRASRAAPHVRTRPKRQNHSALTMGVVFQTTRKKYWGNVDVHGDVHCLGFPDETKNFFRDDQIKELIRPPQFCSCVKDVSWTFDPQAPVIHRLAAGYCHVILRAARAFRPEQAGAERRLSRAAEGRLPNTGLVLQSADALFKLLKFLVPARSICRQVEVYPLNGEKDIFSVRFRGHFLTNSDELALGGLRKLLHACIYIRNGRDLLGLLHTLFIVPGP